jgi:hypothetical protein
MGRSILAGVAGYLAMFVFIMVFFTVAFVVIGTDRAFQAGSYDISTLWVGVWAIGTIVAALLGGFVCAKVAKAGSRAVVGLAVAVVVLGVLSAVMSGAREAPGPRAADVPVIEAAGKAVQPVWMPWANIVVGVVGVLAGGRLGAKKPV